MRLHLPHTIRRMPTLCQAPRRFTPTTSLPTTGTPSLSTGGEILAEVIQWPEAGRPLLVVTGMATPLP